MESILVGVLFNPFIDSINFVVYVGQAIGGQAPRNLMDHFAEILFALNKHCVTYLSVWLKEVMQQQNFPSSRLTQGQKDTFSQQILRYVS